ncbi:MAG: hypothetical protein GF416_02655 [Candidatus Altiarchaeales archaeon]|nr:hypothetical protein [Candidatus Altiarchaeales archaeon]MBD3416020.1 hypothetical protein [Candidatus Altiarchaeales archaeon]
MDFRLASRSVVVSGLLTAILSVVPPISYYNMFCGAWVVLGGVLSVFLYERSVDERLSYVDGGLLGLLTGLLAGLLSAVVAMTGFTVFSAVPLWNNLVVAAGMAVFVVIIIAVLFSLFGAVGGLLGMVIFGGEDLKREYNYDTDYVTKLKKEMEDRKTGEEIK